MKITPKIAANLLAMFKTLKLLTGVSNNAAILVMLDAHDKIKTHPHYKHAVKAAYKHALEEWHNYERRLLHDEGSFFTASCLSDEERKRYGSITSNEKFEMWKGMGAKAYTDTQPLITSLWNKHRLSLLNHKIENADSMAWVMTAQSALDISLFVYEWTISDGQKQGISRTVSNSAFSHFRLGRLAKAWRRAMIMTDESVRYVDLEDVERRNIEYGIRQLYETWLNPNMYIDSAIAATMDYEDFFRTKGEALKAIDEWKDVREKYYDAIENG